MLTVPSLRETWKVGMDGGAGYAPIVWDLMKLFSSTLEVFFDEWDQRAAQAGTRPAPMRPEWVVELADKIFFSLARFVNRLRQRVGSWQVGCRIRAGC